MQFRELVAEDDEGGGKKEVSSMTLVNCTHPEQET